VNADCQTHVREKGRTYPIYEDCHYLFADNYSLEGIKIPVNVYKRKLSDPYFSINNSCHQLEENIIRFFIDNHARICSRLHITGMWGIFHQHGKHLMADFPITNQNPYDILVFKLFKSTPRESMQLHDNKVAAALAYFFHEGVYFDTLGMRDFVLANLGENLAKWREE